MSGWRITAGKWPANCAPSARRSWTAAKSLLALAVVVGVAVLREGSEVALFLYGVAASDGGSALSLAIGGFIGLALGVGVCLLTYFGLMRIPPRALFATTTVLITLLAAGMATQAVAFLERADWLTSLDTVVWDSGWLLPETSIAGRTMHTLIGYTDQPTEMQLVVYVAVLLVTFMLMRLTGSQPTDRAVGGRLISDYCSGGSPLVRFLARSISVTAIRISARVLRSGASSIACFSGGP